jgi:hypothetical protein
MHRCGNRGFCCGAGGARIRPEERIGKRINEEESTRPGPGPGHRLHRLPVLHMVMPGDAVNAKKAAGQAVQTLEVIDVAQLVVRSVRTGTDESTGSARGDSPARSG